MNIHAIDRPKPSTQIQTAEQLEPPPLNSGDHLSRAEFERRYQAHPEIKKAELIEGVVYVSSPIRYEKHADPHFDIIAWLGAYRAATPGVKGGDNATLRLDLENEPQPDAMLRLEPEVGGRSSVTEDDYLEGAPELIVEIAASSASYDLHDKRRVYARNGVPEYLVIQTYEQRVDLHQYVKLVRFTPPVSSFFNFCLMSSLRALLSTFSVFVKGMASINSILSGR